MKQEEKQIEKEPTTEAECFEAMKQANLYYQGNLHKVDQEIYRLTKAARDGVDEHTLMLDMLKAVDTLTGSHLAEKAATRQVSTGKAQ